MYFDVTPNGNIYNHGDKLPHELSIQNAKTVSVQDGIAIQGPHSIYSNLHHCDFIYENRNHKSLEQALQYKHAEVCKQQHVANQIMQTDDSYEAMNLGKKLGDNEEWKRDCVTYLIPILKAKFDQNPELRRRLKNVKGHLHEATTHEIFGAGLTLAQSGRICQQNSTAGNKLGLELELLFDPIKASNFINNFFTEIGPKLAKSFKERWIFYGTPNLNAMDNMTVNEDEVIQLCKDINTNKSSAIDISSKVLKLAFLTLSKQLTYIFNLVPLEFQQTGNGLP